MDTATSYEDHFGPVAGPEATAVRVAGARLDGSTVSASAEPAPAVEPAPARVRSVRFTGTRERERVVPLIEPVEIDGVAWTAIRCRRLTARELDEFYSLPREDRMHLPTIDAPSDVLEELDADDIERVREVALGFLPASLRQASGLDPSTSAASSSSSPGT